MCVHTPAAAAAARKHNFEMIEVCVLSLYLYIIFNLCNAGAIRTSAVLSQFSDSAPHVISDSHGSPVGFVIIIPHSNRLVAHRTATQSSCRMVKPYAWENYYYYRISRAVCVCVWWVNTDSVGLVMTSVNRANVHRTFFLYGCTFIIKNLSRWQSKQQNTTICDKSKR